MKKPLAEKWPPKERRDLEKARGLIKKAIKLMEGAYPTLSLVVINRKGAAWVIEE